MCQEWLRSMPRAASLKALKAGGESGSSNTRPDARNSRPLVTPASPIMSHSQEGRWGNQAGTLAGRKKRQPAGRAAGRPAGRQAGRSKAEARQRGDKHARSMRLKPTPWQTQTMPSLVVLLAAVVTVAPVEPAETSTPSMLILAIIVAVAPQPAHVKLQVNVTLAAAVAGHVGVQVLRPLTVPVTLTTAPVMVPERGDLRVRVPVTLVHVSRLVSLVAFHCHAILLPRV
jgi:hypothetical protein